MKYIWDVGVLLLSFGITFMATENWPWMYWPGLVGVYTGIALLSCHAFTEDAFKGLPLGTRIAIGIIGLCLVYIWSANTVFVKLPIDLRAYADKGNYPQGTDVAGIKEPVLFRCPIAAVESDWARLWRP